MSNNHDKIITKEFGDKKDHTPRGLADMTIAKDCIKKLLNTYGATIDVCADITTITITNKDIAKDARDNKADYVLSHRSKFIEHGGRVIPLIEYLVSISTDINIDEKELLEEYNYLDMLFSEMACIAHVKEEDFSDYKEKIFNGAAGEDLFETMPLGALLMERRIVDKKTIAQLFTWREIQESKP